VGAGGARPRSEEATALILWWQVPASGSANIFAEVLSRRRGGNLPVAPFGLRQAIQLEDALEVREQHFTFFHAHASQISVGE